MHTLQKSLEEVKRLTPEEPKEAPKVAPVESPIVSAPTFVQPVVEIREEPTLIAKSNNNMV